MGSKDPRTTLTMDSALARNFPSTTWSPSISLLFWCRLCLCFRDILQLFPEHRSDGKELPEALGLLQNTVSFTWLLLPSGTDCKPSMNWALPNSTASSLPGHSLPPKFNHLPCSPQALPHFLRAPLLGCPYPWSIWVGPFPFISEGVAHTSPPG